MMWSIVAAALAVALGGCAAAQANETNSERGCLRLQVVVGQVQATPTACPALKELLSKSAKAMFSETTPSTELLACALVMNSQYNRVRSRPDSEKVPNDVSEGIVKSCFMLITNLSENDSDTLDELWRGAKELVNRKFNLQLK